MKELDREVRVDLAEDPEPWVRQGLRALREQRPSDESRRATLAQLGIVDEEVTAEAVEAAAPTGKATGLLPWLLGGVLLGVLVLLVQRWLG